MRPPKGGGIVITFYLSTVACQDAEPGVSSIFPVKERLVEGRMKDTRCSSLLEDLKEN